MNAHPSRSLRDLPTSTRQMIIDVARHIGEDLWKDLLRRAQIMPDDESKTFVTIIAMNEMFAKYTAHLILSSALQGDTDTERARLQAEDFINSLRHRLAEILANEKDMPPEIRAELRAAHSTAHAQ